MHQHQARTGWHSGRSRLAHRRQRSSPSSHHCSKSDLNVRVAEGGLRRLKSVRTIRPVLRVWSQLRPRASAPPGRLACQRSSDSPRATLAPASPSLTRLSSRTPRLYHVCVLHSAPRFLDSTLSLSPRPPFPSHHRPRPPTHHPAATMASRTVFDPTTLVRITPLLAATCTLWANVDHVLFLDFAPSPSFSSSSASTLTPCAKHAPSSPLAALFSLYEANATALAAFVGGACVLFSAPSPSPSPSPSSSLSPSHLSPSLLSPTSSLLSSADAPKSITASIASLFRPDAGSPGSTLFLAGTVLTAAHLAIQPYLSTLVRALAQAQTDGEKRRAARQWRRALVVRALCLDLPAWVCFLAGAMASLRPVEG